MLLQDSGGGVPVYEGVSVKVRPHSQDSFVKPILQRFHTNDKLDGQTRHHGITLPIRQTDILRTNRWTCLVRPVFRRPGQPSSPRRLPLNPHPASPRTPPPQPAQPHAHPIALSLAKRLTRILPLILGNPHTTQKAFRCLTAPK